MGYPTNVTDFTDVQLIFKHGELFNKMGKRGLKLVDLEETDDLRAEIEAVETELRNRMSTRVK